LEKFGGEMKPESLCTKDTVEVMYNASEPRSDKAQGATFHNTMKELLFPKFFSADTRFVIWSVGAANKSPN
jgi:hypothetical protein